MDRSPMAQGYLLVRLGGVTNGELEGVCVVSSSNQALLGHM